MQSYVEINENQTMKESLPLLLNNIKTAISQNSGTAFPSANLELGMPVYRADQKKLYVLTDTGSQKWDLVFDFNNIKPALNHRPIGWYTIAVNTGNRATARFGVRDTYSSRHQSVVFYASHHYGNDASNTITVLQNSYFGKSPIRYIRIKENGTYEGAALQVYIDDASNDLSAYLLGDNFQSNGWVMCDWIPDETAPPLVSNWHLFTAKGQVDLDNAAQGGMITTGEIYAGGDTTQYKVWHSGNDGSGSGLDADTVDGLQASKFVRNDVTQTFSGESFSVANNNNPKLFVEHTSGQWVRMGAGTSGTSIKFSNTGSFSFGPVSSKTDTTLVDTFIIEGNGDVKIHGQKAWHAGNDGAGSGLDADTVDGLQAGQFVRRDTFDLVFGNHDQSTRGSSGSSRALVKELGKLTINFDNDFGKTRIKGTAVEITHNLGVGTDAPTEKVDVIGKVKARDGIIVGSSSTAHIAFNDATQCLEFNFA